MLHREALQHRCTTFAFEAMRCRFELVLCGEDQRLCQSVSEEIAAEVFACEARLSIFSHGSLLSLINREAGRRAVEVDPDTFELLLLARAVHAASGGAFDPTVGPLMRAWGLRSSCNSDPHSPYFASELAAAATIGMHHVVLDAARQTVYFASPGIELDLGAIAKGHALDLASNLIRQYQIPAALAHAGTSSVVCIGNPAAFAQTPGHAAATQPGWKIQLASPPAASAAHADIQRGPHATVTLCDVALGVSAPHGRGVHDAQGNYLGHVIDPRTRHPANTLLMAAAICSTAAAADAWSTALLCDPESAMRQPEEAAMLACDSSKPYRPQRILTMPTSQPGSWSLAQDLDARPSASTADEAAGRPPRHSFAPTDPLILAQPLCPC